MTLAQHDASTYEVPQLDPVGDLLLAVASDLGVHCLVESRSGGVAAHALLGPPSPAVTAAVLARDVSGLQNSARQRRTVGLLPTGPVERFLVDDDTALVVPLASFGQQLGWLWLLGDVPAASDPALVTHAEALSRLLSAVCSRVGDTDGSRLLAGIGPLPADLTGGPLHVASVRAVAGAGTGVAAALSRVVAEHRARDVRGLVVATGAGADLVLVGQPELVERTLQSWLEAAGTALRTDLAAALGAPVSTVADLPRARRQAHTVLSSAALPGRCRTLATARAAVAMAHVNAALDTLPDLGDDPLDRLLEHDRSRRSELAPTLLAWLESHADVTVAAECLTVHPNTFRYRLSRAVEVIGVDLHDPVVRLDVHLRLRRSLQPARQAPSDRPATYVSS